MVLFDGIEKIGDSYVAVMTETFGRRRIVLNEKSLRTRIDNLRRQDLAVDEEILALDALYRSEEDDG